MGNLDEISHSKLILIIIFGATFHILVWAEIKIRHDFLITYPTLQVCYVILKYVHRWKRIIWHVLKVG